MLYVLIDNVTTLSVELRDAKLAVGFLAAIDRTTGKQGCQFRNSNAKDLLMQNMVYTFLTVWYLRLQPSIKSLYYLTKEDSALGKWVKKRSVGIAEQLLWQEVKHLVSQLWRRKHFVVTQIGDAV